MTIQLSPSDHNGYAISCFGGRDGHIDLTVSGGSPPYTYEWSTGASTQDVSDLAAGYYRVAVYDNNGGSAQGEITLGEPEQLMGTATAFEYPNDFHV
ncbi:MAG: SprB repeat-containing protein, partial [Flavobacteriales bacterium]|nr:SprB repeat-containing protein [Flavobacteriales bacterium]